MKLLAADFDCTFFDGKNFEKNIKYVNKFVSSGNIFVIVTGRYLDSLLSDIKNHNLHYDYLLCNDGGTIFDNKLNIIYRKDIPHSVAVDIADIYMQSQCLDSWYIDTGLIITQDKDNIANGLIGKFNDKLRAQKLLDFIKDKHSEINGYLSNTWINITEKSVNKGYGVKKLIEMLNINEKDVYTIGDNINDVSMANFNFNSYCMERSVSELKRVSIRPYSAVYQLVKDILKEDGI